ncbi:hypothetical protein ABZ714_17910 [Streptomyces sp. NPDC006798]|uniref:hypothetical protein n=1 Tax=Streptomyces sp. NPDC006798 TaxID=3155462 RepID=UPI003408DEB7
MLGDDHPGPWEPQVGDTVRDTARDRIGRVVARTPPRYALRPLGGGIEWDAFPTDLRPVKTTDLLRPSLTEINKRSSRGHLT